MMGSQLIHLGGSFPLLVLKVNGKEAHGGRMKAWMGSHWHISPSIRAQGMSLIPKNSHMDFASE